MQNPPKKLALIGTFIRDRIVPLHGPEIQCLGGLYHSIAYAALLGGAQWHIVPHARVGSDSIDTVRQALAGFDTVDLSQLVVSSHKNTTVQLVYKTATSRDEITSTLMRPLHIDELHACLAADGILVNLITGSDLALEALQQLASRTKVPIYLDFHSLALGIDAHGKRFYRRPENWRHWLKTVDFVQMNGDEAACLSGKSGFEALQQFLQMCLKELNLSGMHITFGEQGVLSGVRSRSGVVETRHLPAVTDSITVHDIIGCGDAFGAAFLVHFLSNGEFWHAAEFANTIAARNTTFMGSLTTELFESKIKPYAHFEK